MDAIAPCPTAMFVCYDCALSATSSICDVRSSSIKEAPKRT